MPSLTSPYKFYQFLVNVDDRDAGRYLRYFTMLTREAIEAHEQSVESAPEKRGAQHALAAEVTTRVHGERAAATAREVSDLLFGGGDARALSRDALAALAVEIPVFTVSFTDQLTTADVLDAVCAGPDALFKSKGDMRRMVQQGGVYLNGRRLGPEREPIGFGELLGGEYLLIRKGAKTYALVRVRRS